MNARLLATPLFSALLALAACGNSPLFNHDNADRLKPDNANVTTGDCPIEFHQAKLCASVEWIQGPTGQGESSLSLKFWDSLKRDSAGPFVDPTNSVAVELWMPDMGHGSSPVTIEKTGVGEYHVSKVYFIMPGDWDLRVQLKNDTTVVEQAVVPVTVH